MFSLLPRMDYPFPPIFRSFKSFQKSPALRLCRNDIMTQPKLPLQTAIPNSHNPNFMMIAVESGPEHIGAWRQEERNIYEDYRKYFGEEPPKVGAIAIMTDTDNTGEEATACYGPIRILPQLERRVQ